MPTPRDSTDGLPPQLEPHAHSSCPPDVIDRPAQWRQQVLGDIEDAIADVATGADRDVVAAPDAVSPEILETHDDQDLRKTRRSDSTLSRPESTPSPAANASPAALCLERDVQHVRLRGTGEHALDLPYSARYNIPSPRCVQSYNSSKLRPGSRFKGTQRSDQSQYNVQVEIKTVDMAEYFICGYLKIEDLTPEHATLTTYFEGEIIGPKYTFQTRHDSWGASEKDDMKHWAQFPAWKPLAKQAKKPGFSMLSRENSEDIFMRWKEQFLVPDFRVKEITGASFEGFYYICFNQVSGRISGIYYHSRSDHHQNNKMQNLELSWQPDKGCFAAFEFR